MTLPIIGVTPILNEKNLQVRMKYVNAISNENGVPIILPKLVDEAHIKAQIDSIDGLLLTGGDDVDPNLFGEDPHQRLGHIEAGRDSYEMKLIDHALAQGKPILGICRGAQIMNVHQGGTMYQDIYEQMENEIIGHSQKAAREFPSHEVTIVEGTKLYEIIGEKTIRTNSFHHQANKVLAGNFVISASTSDGVIEGIESIEHEFFIGLQWHPEDLYDHDKASQKIFKAFIKAANN